MSSYQTMSPTEVARLIDTVLYRRFSVRSSGGTTHAEDVVHEAFIKLVRQHRPPEDAVAWLYRVVRNGAIDQPRSARRRMRGASRLLPGRCVGSSKQKWTASTLKPPWRPLRNWPTNGARSSLRTTGAG